MGCSWRGVRRSDERVWTVASKFSWLAFLFVLLLCMPAAAQQTVRVGVYDNPPKVAIDEAGAVSGLYPALLEHITAEEGWSSSTSRERGPSRWRASTAARST